MAKYTKLLAVIHVPGDKGDYGEFKDYGAFDGTEWASYKGLPKGDWVYVYPHCTLGKEGQRRGCFLPLKKAHGRWQIYQAAGRHPRARRQGDYGEFKDYGAFDGTEWASYKGLPKGNWVYVYPHWYIWKRRTNKGGTGDFQIAGRTWSCTRPRRQVASTGLTGSPAAAAGGDFGTVHGSHCSRSTYIINPPDLRNTCTLRTQQALEWRWCSWSRRWVPKGGLPSGKGSQEHPPCSQRSVP